VAEVLVGAAGILTPALLLYTLSSSEGDNNIVVIDNSNGNYPCLLSLYLDVSSLTFRRCQSILSNT
jgi:hypothetical protein